MLEIEFKVPPNFDSAQAERAVEPVCAAHGLHIAMKATLASFPGSIHWHFKNQKEKGTLELTVFPQDRRIWAQIQDGRKAGWIDAMLPKIQRAIERELRRAAAPSRRAARA
ncbi:MAG TPA: hypothetical protein VEV17_05050 [Bryobacteraceae bacterium]|nr:hypothetical protein [Bryobacteraceae bacterium]